MRLSKVSSPATLPRLFLINPLNFHKRKASSTQWLLKTQFSSLIFKCLNSPHLSSAPSRHCMFRLLWLLSFLGHVLDSCGFYSPHMTWPYSCEMYRTGTSTATESGFEATWGWEVFFFHRALQFFPSPCISSMPSSTSTHPPWTHGFISSSIVLPRQKYWGHYVCCSQFYSFFKIQLSCHLLRKAVPLILFPCALQHLCLHNTASHHPLLGITANGVKTNLHC